MANDISDTKCIDRRDGGALVFDKYETRGAYHWEWYAKNGKGYRDLVERTLGFLPEQGGTLVDIGCGDGLLSYRAMLRGFNVLGIDTSMCGVELARLMAEKASREMSWQRFLPSSARRWLAPPQSLSRLRFECMSVFDLKAVFDYGVMQEVIEHIEDARGAVEAVARLVRKEAVITAPNGDYMEQHPLDYNSWTPRTFLELFDGYECRMADVRRETMTVVMKGVGELQADAAAADTCTAN